MKNVLVLCTGNSCRSQLAEGFLRHFAENKANIYSAGIEVHGLNPRAVKVMAESGLDIAAHTSNHIDEYAHINFDYVITVCDNAKESCPFFPTQAQKFHYNFPDPAKATGTEEEVMNAFRQVRDMIKIYASDFAENHLN
ncbi:MAG: arsenate reductase ArsC [Pedobacter sp.]|uniref:arsenate reductase ArsC n=1 Tax=Pedobacter sp. TaxID=1411316 RepID=UPI00339103CD